MVAAALRADMIAVARHGQFTGIIHQPPWMIVIGSCRCVNGKNLWPERGFPAVSANHPTPIGWRAARKAGLSANSLPQHQVQMGMGRRGHPPMPARTSEAPRLILPPAIDTFQHPAPQHSGRTRHVHEEPAPMLDHPRPGLEHRLLQAFQVPAAGRGEPLCGGVFFQAPPAKTPIAQAGLVRIRSLWASG